MSLYEIRDLRIDFPTRLGTVEAVRGVTFEIGERECVALVGESGCGKSVTARALMGLTEAAGGRVRPGGSILCAGEDILGYSERQWRAYRGSRAAIIFQDAMTALNPTMRIGRQIWECCLLHRRMSRREAREQAVSLLERVGIPQPRQALDRYPHEFSGGMRQRVVIAQALACGPALLIADEPTTALDVTIQAQILELLQELREREGNSILLITHDLGVVAGMAQRIVVMYAGVIVEMGTTDEIFYEGQHPYTAGLKAASPRLDADSGERLYTIEGAPPELIRPSPGCPFAPRCARCAAGCREELPPMRRLSDTHFVRCPYGQQEGGAQ
ncbi:MAG: ABC transporter ATP-binding protein [Oscillospiraceae bacterium]|jgi:oligopeptide transport system ATP-binding protein|nr:ABC transporter ATP-binding protein [Oscillospiraceae bacterium]MDE6935183.1 ABC transporter ATP-binding protein [Oscillospiraceae bacterium]